MAEEWRIIAGFPEYEVSSLGNIRTKTRMLRKCVIALGYERVTLYCPGTRLDTFVHRLVAEAFLPNPEGKRTIDHINRDRADNRVENLRWATHTEQNFNRKHRESSTGHKYIRKQRDTWVAQVLRKGLSRWQKVFSTLEEAIIARDEYLKQIEAT